MHEPLDPVEKPGGAHGGPPETLWPCGVLGRPHGLRGELALTPAPEGLTYFEYGARFWVAPRDGSPPEEVAARRVGGTDRSPYLRLGGVETREQAAGYTGALLLASGGRLDELPQYVVGRLIGLVVVCGDRTLGRVADVMQGVAHEVLVVHADDGEEVLLPLVEELVTVDEERRLVIIREGLVE